MVKIVFAGGLLSASAAGSGAFVLILLQGVEGGTVLGPFTLIPLGVVSGLFILAVGASWKASKFIERLINRIEQIEENLSELKKRQDLWMSKNPLERK